MNPLPSPLLVITDRRQAARPIETVAEEAFRGGCRWLSLREKDLPADKRLALLRRILAVAAPFGATVIVHDDLEAAAHCAGVHLPADGDAAAARRRLGPRALIGVSAHGIEQAVAAQSRGADYATLSPIFPTESKPGYGPALGPGALSAARELLDMPLVALGGIEPATLAACLDAGAAGVAVMGPVMRAASAEDAVRGLLQAVPGR